MNFRFFSKVLIHGLSLSFPLTEEMPFFLTHCTNSACKKHFTAPTVSAKITRTQAHDKVCFVVIGQSSAEAQGQDTHKLFWC